jgi:hypothetical protein
MSSFLVLLRVYVEGEGGIFALCLLIFDFPVRDSLHSAQNFAVVPT